MHHWFDSWPIDLLSVPRCQSVSRFSDFVMTPLEGRAAAVSVLQAPHVQEPRVQQRERVRPGRRVLALRRLAARARAGRGSMRTQS